MGNGRQRKILLEDDLDSDIIQCIDVLIKRMLTGKYKWAFINRYMYNRLLIRALKHTSGNKLRALRLLGFKSRNLIWP